MPLMCSLVDWTQLRKESLSWRMYQQKPPKLKGNEDKDQKTQNKISKECGTTTKAMANSVTSALAFHC
jgi:hypothetical protein